MRTHTRPRPTVRSARLALLIAAIAAVAGCGTAPSEPTPDVAGTKSRSATKTARAKSRPGTALAALAELTVKGRAPKTGYDREQFGGDWASVSGCDMRDRILARDLDELAYEPGSDCDVAAGVLADPYTATRIRFARGGAADVDVDHVVALGDAWQKGAQQWSYAQRVRFANDPLNLLAADASSNRQKADADAASWLPSNKRFRCQYVARQIAVKRRYDAWVTGAERDAMARVLERCADEPLPTAHRPHVLVRAAPVPEPNGEAGDAVKAGARKRFENCDAVRAAGMAPLTRGDGVYEANPEMDRDGDGVACE